MMPLSIPPLSNPAPTAPAVPATLQPSQDAELRKAAEAFEAIILRQMLSAMRQGKLADDIFGSSATDQYRELADARLADDIAGRRQFGIADMVERQLSALKGTSS